MNIHTEISPINHNVTPTNDIRTVGKFLGLFIVCIVALYGLFLLSSNRIVDTFIPIEKERARFGGTFLKSFSIATNTTERLEKTHLTRFSGQLSDVRIFVIDEPTMGANAAAMLGGDIIITKEMLDTIQTREELIFIIGHELAHVAGQDALRATMTNIPLQLLLALAGVDGTTSLIASLPSMASSKDSETKADAAGLDFLVQILGHAGCSTGFFGYHNTTLENVGTFLSDHPMTANRIQALEARIKEKKYAVLACASLGHTGEKTKQ